MVPRIWQEIDEQCHSCHSWQEPGGRTITAMTVLTVILLVVALAALVRGATYLYDFVTNDGYGHLTAHAAPPRSHHRDPFDPRFA
jgi:hypothetical protein